MRTLTVPLALFCAAAFTVTAGEPAKPSPPLTIQRVGSPAVQLSQFRGKIVLLAFISTTCPHCQALTQMLSPIAREYEARGVQVVACAFNPNADQLVGAFIQQFAPAFPVGWADNNTVMVYVGRSVMDTTPFYVPHLVFLDRRGLIQGDFAGESDFMKAPEPNIRAELEKLLKAGSAAAAKSK